MKECFAITTYCNTEEKIQALNKTIDNIKQYELPIILHAHYPLSDDIQRKVNFYIYSSDNPVLPRANLIWLGIDGYKLEIVQHDYGYTVAKGWVELIQNSRDYDRIHMINYDTDLTPELFNIAKQHSKSVFLKHPFTSGDSIFPLYFALNKVLFDTFKENLTLENYMKFESKHNDLFCANLEEYTPTFINTDDFFMVPIEEYDSWKLYTNSIPHGLIHYMHNEGDLWNRYLKLYKTKFFIGNYEYENYCSIFFFHVQEEINIKIKINDLYMSSKISSSELINFDIPVKEIKNMEITINNIVVDKDLIKEFLTTENYIYKI